MKAKKAHQEKGSSHSSDFADISKLKLTQDFSAIVGVKKLITTVPVRKPGKQEFFRVRSGDEWSLNTAIIEIKEDRETYLVDRSLWSELPGELIPKVLFTVLNRQNVLSLWPVRLPGEDGRHDAWSRSALEAAELAKEKWIRVVANMSLGAYEVSEASADIPEPKWPDISFEDILEIAFRDKFIKDFDHPVLKKLRGES